MDSVPVAVIGAGPYGLSVAAHLRQAGVPTRVFGDPMAFWSERMPDGMQLRSGWDGSHIADAAGALTLDVYQAVQGRQLPRPIRLCDFVAYGKWFAEQVVPEVDRRQVTQVEKAGGQLRLGLSDGGMLAAGQVVVATGISEFARVPPAFRGLPTALVSHTSTHRSFEGCKAKDVLIVGGGQSALEYAALLHEAGAEVEVVVRHDRIHWLTHGAGSRLNTALQSRSNPLRPLLFPPSEIGPVGISLLVDKPALYTHVPTPRLRGRVSARALRPAGAQWLRPRLDSVPLHTDTAVVSCEVVEDRLRLTLTDGSTRIVDHLLLATGYQVDVTRCAFLSPSLLAGVRSEGGYPVLSKTLESSVPGLHFAGAAAAGTVGPLMRFVAGTGYAARAVARAAASAYSGVRGP
jgi:thioredoxin reductase